MTFDSVESAIEAIKKGQMVIVSDDEDRENEGDLIMAAELVTSEAINFMITHAKGLICAPLTDERAKSLGLSSMVAENLSTHETAFTVSVDSVHGGTGISAPDRARTLRALVDANTKPADLMRPGHIFPLIAKSGGVLRRAGHTEAAVDLCKLAGLQEVGVICEILAEDGSMATRDTLALMAQKYGLKFITIKDLIQYRTQLECQVKETANIHFPNQYGTFRLHMFESQVHQTEHHVAMVKGPIDPSKPVLVRVHSECFTGDIFGSMRCDCGEQLKCAMEMIEQEGQGVLLYMRQEGRGIGLPNKIRAYTLQDQGHDTVTANHKLGFKTDLREYGVGAQILKHLGVGKIRLLTNNPKKVVGLEAFGLSIVERLPIEIKPNPMNQHYLETKRDKLGHTILTETRQ